MDASAGTDADDSEWIVLEQNDWTGLGSHDFTGSCEGGNYAVVYDCDGVCLNDADGDGVCDELEIAAAPTVALATTTALPQTTTVPVSTSLAQVVPTLRRATTTSLPQPKTVLALTQKPSTTAMATA